MFSTWNQTITVYSRYVDKQNRAVRWVGKVLHNCFVGKERIRDWNNRDAILSEEYVVRIPQNADFLASAGLELLANTDLFTLSPGNVVFLGEVDDEIDDETDGLRMSDRRIQYGDQCFEIKRFSDNTKVGFLPHYRVEG